jgi:hypothetical protein
VQPSFVDSSELRQCCAGVDVREVGKGKIVGRQGKGERPVVVVNQSVQRLDHPFFQRLCPTRVAKIASTITSWVNPNC